ncbi:hypothetical protein [Methylobacterium nigriterrae]|uniref:hypothetical protein n=1 Tax=Methylobacterium nigriterrae TaxID=3127512 RepID=UPI0030133186
MTNASWFGTSTHYVSSTGGEVYGLYEGLLDRAPDPLSEGWHTLLDKGTSLHDVTEGFLTSPEGQSHFNAPDNAGFVEQLYETVLGRSVMGRVPSSGLQLSTAAPPERTSRTASSSPPST